MIAAIILFTIAGIILLFSIVISAYTQVSEWLIGTVVSIVFGVCGVASLDLTPTNMDVREGEAHYIEQNHVEVVNGDTINTYKTYQIEWIENSK